MSTFPASLKALLAVVKRAEELEKSNGREEKVVAYYCFMYFVTKAMKLTKNPTAEESKFISEQISKLEKLKPSLQLAAGEGSRICVEYANKIFHRADDIDRSGLADKAVAKLFYAAGTFFDILEQFDDVDKEKIEKKKLYAKQRFSDIINAVNSGVQPTPGGFEEQGVPDEAGSSATPQSSSATEELEPRRPATYGATFNSIPSPPGRQPAAAPSQPIIPSIGKEDMIAPAIPPAINDLKPIYPASKPSSSPMGPSPGFQVPRAPPINMNDPRVKDSVELCNFAISALKHNDIALARERLQEALRRLG